MPALFDVDTQRDFIEPDGALYVPRSEEIRPNLGRLVRAAREARLLLVSSADSHVPNDPEFAKFGFPPHCVRGTAGEQRIPETVTGEEVMVPPDAPLPAFTSPPLPGGRFVHFVVEKRHFSPFSNPHLEHILETVGEREFVVFGVATDYCVRAAALGLIERGRRVRIVVDAVRAVDRAAGERALRELEALGAGMVLTDDVLRELETKARAD